MKLGGEINLPDVSEASPIISIKINSAMPVKIHLNGSEKHTEYELSKQNSKKINNEFSESDVFETESDS